MIPTTTVKDSGDTTRPNKDLEDWFPSSGPEKGEVWETVPVKSSRRRRKRNKMINTEGGSMVSTAATSDSCGGGTVKKEITFAAATRGDMHRAAVASRPRTRVRTGLEPRSVASAVRHTRVGIRKTNSAVVMIRCEEGGPSYAEIMGEVRTGGLFREVKDRGHQG